MDDYLSLWNGVYKDVAINTIQKLLEDPRIYGFGEFYEMRVRSDPISGDLGPWNRLLEIFCYGSVRDVREDEWNALLSPPQRKKLQILTLLSEARQHATLDIKGLIPIVRGSCAEEVENLWVEAFQLGLVRGIVDQPSGIIQVKFAQARDVRPEAIESLRRVLDRFSAHTARTAAVVDSSRSVAAEIVCAQRAHNAQFERDHSAASALFSAVGESLSSELVVPSSGAAALTGWEDGPSRKRVANSQT